MKSALVLGLMILAGTAYASGGPIPDYSYQVGIASITTNIITVSTSVATQMDNPTLSQRVAIEINNIDASANLWCLPTSSPAPATNAGRKITAGSAWEVAFHDRTTVPNDPTRVYSSTNTNVYCVSDGGSSTKAAVSQAY